MPEGDKATPLCPRCAKPISVLVACSLPVAAAGPAALPVGKDETIPVYVCPSCKVILGVGGGSYIGSITFKT